MTIGENIKSLRKMRGITQEDLGNMLGVSGSMIAQYETGKRNPKHSTLEKLSQALEVPVMAFYGATVWYSPYYDPYQEREIITPEELGAVGMISPLNLSDCINRIYNALMNLNDIGLQKAVERIEELAEISRYQKAPSQPPQAPTPLDGEITQEDKEKPSESPTEANKHM